MLSVIKGTENNMFLVNLKDNETRFTRQICHIQKVLLDSTFALFVSGLSAELSLGATNREGKLC